MWFLEDRLWSQAITLSGSFPHAWCSGQGFAMGSDSAHDHLPIPSRAHAIRSRSSALEFYDRIGEAQAVL